MLISEILTFVALEYKRLNPSITDARFVERQYGEYLTDEEGAFGGPKDYSINHCYARLLNSVRYETPEQRYSVCNEGYDVILPGRLVVVVPKSVDRYLLEYRTRQTFEEMDLKQLFGTGRADLDIREAHLQNLSVGKDEFGPKFKFDGNMLLLAVDFDLTYNWQNADCDRVALC